MPSKQRTYDIMDVPMRMNMGVDASGSGQNEYVGALAECAKKAYNYRISFIQGE